MVIWYCQCLYSIITVGLKLMRAVVIFCTWRLLLSIKGKEFHFWVSPTKRKRHHTCWSAMSQCHLLVNLRTAKDMAVFRTPVHFILMKECHFCTWNCRAHKQVWGKWTLRGFFQAVIPLQINLHAWVKHQVWRAWRKSCMLDIYPVIMWMKCGLTCF